MLRDVLAMTEPLTITLTGKVQPYTRMTQRGKYVSPKAQKYLASQEAMAWQMAQQVSEKPHFPKEARLSVSIHLHGKYRRGDLDNRQKACLDAAKGILWYDDQQIDELYIWRGLAGEYQTDVFVYEIRKGERNNEQGNQKSTERLGTSTR